MEQDVTSFWPEIQKHEEALAKDPASYSFVPLADIYRKVGLLDEAIETAKKGCELHPDYAGGFMALGRACLEKGMKDESRSALEKVIAITPDNIMARRILSQIYVDHGEMAAARESLRYILSVNPADQKCRTLLDSLDSNPREELSETSGANLDKESSGEGGQFFEFLPEEDEIIEDAELLEDFVDDATPGEEEFIRVSSLEEPIQDEKKPSGEDEDPLITATMAELYASQGFLKRALTIYRGLLETDPDNVEWNNRLYELKMAIDEDTAIARKGAMEEGSTVSVLPFHEELPASVGEDLVKVAPEAVGEETVLATLGKWLETIRRRR